ncbi:prolipoprotein diacylglyceryl transferase [Rickettsia endosymbiont of Cardiosporidium cionae]|uniref:prolipoprotein diacylglyceryl transferase n=1 Tax=Rickettsia endosymbiont of Cardiosporidium cionae TaxID=2777155 RepID=UPI0018938058|nr:prolipoprotein diacylglyceryl transferase [Rickettsia endosymbiont of Cardiosporidium cionae]KAF8818856.1 prolipoprotein diacylglyceryl transferase [Rickettsia endosymbiont of Cardiosporidium cionae]
MLFPDIDPVLFRLGPLNIYWYSIAYIVGILFGEFYAKKIVTVYRLGITEQHIGNFVFFSVLSIILGGRLGYVIFYGFKYYFDHPVEIFKIYDGNTIIGISGMSFHGALILFVFTAYIFAKINKINFFSLIDISSLVSPLGIMLGRIGNFINGELYGRTTSVPWGMIFPSADNQLRHPSQLYEAALEGLVLFIILSYLNIKYKLINYPKILTGLFFITYSIFRIITEFFREPDISIGFVANIFTLGQILSVPMLLLGLYLLITAFYNKKLLGNSLIK